MQYVARYKYVRLCVTMSDSVCDPLVILSRLWHLGLQCSSDDM